MVFDKNLLNDVDYEDQESKKITNLLDGSKFEFQFN